MLDFQAGFLHEYEHGVNPVSCVYADRLSASLAFGIERLPWLTSQPKSPTQGPGTRNESGRHTLWYRSHVFVSSSREGTRRNRHPVHGNIDLHPHAVRREHDAITNQACYILGHAIIIVSMRVNRTYVCAQLHGTLRVNDDYNEVRVPCQPARCSGRRVHDHNEVAQQTNGDSLVERALVGPLARACPEVYHYIDVA